MVPEMLKSIVSGPGLLFACPMAQRSDQTPLSLRFVTVKVALYDQSVMRKKAAMIRDSNSDFLSLPILYSPLTPWVDKGSHNTQCLILLIIQ